MRHHTQVLHAYRESIGAEQRVAPGDLAQPPVAPPEEAGIDGDIALKSKAHGQFFPGAPLGSGGWGLKSTLQRRLGFLCRSRCFLLGRGAR